MPDLATALTIISEARAKYLVEHDQVVIAALTAAAPATDEREAQTLGAVMRELQNALLAIRDANRAIQQLAALRAEKPPA